MWPPPIREHHQRPEDTEDVFLIPDYRSASSALLGTWTGAHTLELDLTYMKLPMPIPRTVRRCSQPTSARSAPGRENQCFRYNAASPLQDAALCIHLLTTSRYFSTPSNVPRFCGTHQHLFWDLIKVPYHHGKRGARANKTALMN